MIIVVFCYNYNYKLYFRQMKGIRRTSDVRFAVTIQLAVKKALASDQSK
jgi:hypothetical protein